MTRQKKPTMATATKPIKMPMIPPDCERRRMEFPPFTTLRCRGAECSRRLSESHFHVRLVLQMHGVSEPHAGWHCGHDDGLRAGAVAEETHALQQVTVSNAARRENNILARCQLLRGVDLIDVADTHGLHPRFLLVIFHDEAA